MKRTLVILVAVLGCARPQFRAPTGEVVLTVDGRLRGSPVRIDAAALEALEQRTVRGRAPRSSSELTYEGASLAALIERLEPREGVDIAVVHGSDGYGVAIPLPAIWQSRPVLADRVGGRAVREVLGEDAGTLVLAWPSEEAPGFEGDPRTRWWWPRDVEKIELLPWRETYGRALRVPPGASDEARRGADAFATSCIQCHRMRGAGGTRGPDLSAGIAATGRDRLVEAVRAHEARLADVRGQDLTRRLPEIAAFLAAVESAPPPLPGEEPPQEQPAVEPDPALPPLMPPIVPM